MDIIWPLALILGLVFLHAVFVAADYSLIKLHFTRFDTALLDRAKSRRSIVKLMGAAGRYARAIRYGGIACTLGVGVLLVFVVERVFEIAGIAAGDAGARGLTWAACFIFAWFLLTVVGELVPRALGIRYPVQSLGASSVFIRVFAGLMQPLSALLEKSANRLLKACNAEAGQETSLIDVEVQIRSLLSDGDEVSPITERILSNALQLRALVVQDVVIPRNRLQYFDLEDENAANIDIARKSGHTRFPLCEGDLDRCIGLVHIKDLFRQKDDLNSVDLRKYRRDIQRFSVDDSLDFVLERFLQQKMHMALAVDEFGGAVGAITLEDILEELVGEIHDEFDREETQIQPQEDGSFNVDGLAPIHDVAERLSIELPDTEVSTFGGLITSELGRMPRDRESFLLGPLKVTVNGVTEKRVLSAQIRLASPPEEGPEKDR